LATSSGTGYTVVWDLRGKREVVALAYGGNQSGSQTGSGRRGMSDVAWHPDNVGGRSFHRLNILIATQATRLVTSSEDDASPIIMVWDLRNARAPEKVKSNGQRSRMSPHGQR
jgi:protein transport protein SEC31